MSNTNSLSVSEYNEKLVQRFFKNNHLPFDRKETAKDIIFSTEISVEIEENVSVNTFLLMTINIFTQTQRLPLQIGGAVVIYHG